MHALACVLFSNIFVPDPTPPTRTGSNKVLSVCADCFKQQLMATIASEMKQLEINELLHYKIPVKCPLLPSTQTTSISKEITPLDIHMFVKFALNIVSR